MSDKAVIEIVSKRSNFVGAVITKTFINLSLHFRPCYT